MHYLKSIIFLLFSYAICGHQYNLTIAAIFKDEAPYLKEWIEYHKLMGVEQFRLYDNDSEDDPASVLAPYITKGEVILITVHSSKEALHSWAYSCQEPAYLDAINYYKGISKWVALIDIDEFLLPLDKPDMVSFLRDYENYPGVVLNWQCFGTSFVEEIPNNELLIETLTLKANERSIYNVAVKSIARPEYVDTHKMSWVAHTFFYLDGRLAVHTDNTPRPIHSNKICLEGAVINHYAHRSERHLWENKICKKVRMENRNINEIRSVYQRQHRNFNKIEDKRIFRFSRILKQKIFPNTEDTSSADLQKANNISECSFVQKHSR